MSPTKHELGRVLMLSSPTREPLQIPFGSPPRGIGNVPFTATRASPRSRQSPQSPLRELPDGAAAGNMTTSMGETTRDYVFIDTNVVEFNRKVDGAYVIPSATFYAEPSNRN